MRFGEMETSVAIVFDDQVVWDGGILHLRAIRGGERIRCRAGRETIAELAGIAPASSLEVGARDATAAGHLEASIVPTFEIRGHVCWQVSTHNPLSLPQH